MKAVVHAYAEVMKLIRHLPPRTRSYYSQFARENFVTYSQEQDPSVIRSLLLRAHHHSCWVLRKYGMDEAVAHKLRRICAEEPIQSNT
ncbi:unnamed protein product [Sphagnum compactum]